MATESNGDLTLQVLNVDKQAGITVDNNEFYQAVSEVIKANPQMGAPNDFSLYPYSVLENNEGEPAVLCLVINRLEKPIQQIIFDLTLGTKDGEYIFNDVAVDLPEEYMGILERDSVVPILLNIEEKDVDLFHELDDENVLLKMENFTIDFVEK